ncbi:MAG: DUF2191 domain-containing protein [Chloroflexota bacterium]|nr:DUF2191 domain-containing protein [Chloroflexota bacterium]
MRTTLTLDDDLAHALRQRARLLDQPFKQVVNDTLRRGLSRASGDAPRRPFRIRTFSSAYAPGIDPLRLTDIANDLDDERYFEARRGDGVDDS